MFMTMRGRPMMRTDLKKCARIFLTKQLEVTRETQLEMRGEVHSKISEEEGGLTRAGGEKSPQPALFELAEEDWGRPWVLSNVTNSENRAKLYLIYKDHKKVPGKTRPIAMGCTRCYHWRSRWQMQGRKK